APQKIDLHPADLGFAAKADCTLNAQNLWTKSSPAAVSTLQANVASHDTAIWRIHPSSSCGKPTRSGAITMIAPGKHRESIEGYTVCLATPGKIEGCAGTPAEAWTITNSGALKSAGRCLTVAGDHPSLEACADTNAQHWKYTLPGNLVATDGGCLTATASGLSIESCGHNQRNQVWSLPN
ncbi:MAG TPA: ricin-type beta-trefoil lectin domain protein, partial [Acidobacteriaceae bacterium]|nr:ricin-type beta-trefoil lectin domain protein [Acidobacteriaceae bacterium]